MISTRFLTVTHPFIQILTALLTYPFTVRFAKRFEGKTQMKLLLNYRVKLDLMALKIIDIDLLALFAELGLFQLSLSLMD